MSNHQTILTDENISENKTKSKRSKSKPQPSCFQFKGMTLKEYFRLQQLPTRNSHLPIDQLDEDNYCSSKEAATPCFNNHKPPNDHSNNIRIKVKTQAQEDQFMMGHKKSENNYQFMKSGQNGFKSKLSVLGQEKVIQKQHKQTVSYECSKINHNEKSCIKQKLVSMPSQDKANRSTLSSFYHQQKKKKMLNKLKQDKQKVLDPRLSDLFYITKYAKKFNMDIKEIIK